MFFLVFYNNKNLLCRLPTIKHSVVGSWMFDLLTYSECDINNIFLKIFGTNSVRLVVLLYTGKNAGHFEHIGGIHNSIAASFFHHCIL